MEILPHSRTSSTTGYSVPSSTEPAATVSTTLLDSSRDSRDSSEKPPPSPTVGARHAYSASDPPTIRVMNARMYRPRPGSTAKAWTEVSTPERTRKVPRMLSENVQMASSTVQLRKAPRRSVTISEWISAVPASQGMNEAFSTGSQNHHPPQPRT
ncbi:hypothetical protein D3C72_1332860 [compost metagenome]